tara:strand:+ start:201 stop:386 length:186 start_codon:yes stop_codon:yes gene_type:complete
MRITVKLKEPLPDNLFVISEEKILKDLNDFNTIAELSVYITAVMGFTFENFDKHFSIDLII